MPKKLTLEAVKIKSFVTGKSKIVGGLTGFPLCIVPESFNGTCPDTRCP